MNLASMGKDYELPFMRKKDHIAIAPGFPNQSISLVVSATTLPLPIAQIQSINLNKSIH
nr:hypothetical protein Q903MT_gene5217 [Picea sitchensis]